MIDLLENLRGLGTYRHDDMSVALDAIEEIYSLRDNAAILAQQVADLTAERDALRATLDQIIVMCKTGLPEYDARDIEDVASAVLDTQRGHTASADCWCGPELDYVDPDTGVAVYVHKEVQ